MSETATLAGYGELIEPLVVRIERMLPGPIERVWAYVTESDLRRRWFAAGEMDLRVGGRVELVWRNDELTGHPETRPEGADAEHRMQTTITRLDPPHLLAFGFGNAGDVTFELDAVGADVRLVVTHRRLPSREMLLKVSAGWHAHLDVLDAVARDRAPGPFWSNTMRLRDEYAARLPG